MNRGQRPFALYGTRKYGMSVTLQRPVSGGEDPEGPRMNSLTDGITTPALQATFSEMQPTAAICKPTTVAPKRNLVQRPPE
jgi:hypothetical protein